jgi:hypothetical protein
MAAFLLEYERAYCGASSFLPKLLKQGVDPTLYDLDLPHIFSAEELGCYVDSIMNDMRGRPQNEDYEYIRTICTSLKQWSEKGYIVHFK